MENKASEELVQEDGKKNWVVTMIAVVIVVTRFLFKPITGKKKWVMPIVSFVIVVMTFIQLVRAFPSAQIRPRQSVNQVFTEVLMDDGLWLYDLSRRLQELTLALHYEMLLEVKGEDFDFFDMVHLSGFHSFTDEGYAIEWTDMDSGDNTQLQEVAYHWASGLLDAARMKLSTFASSYEVAYLAIHEEGEMITSGHRALYELIYGQIDFDLIDELQDQFEHVMVIRYNNHGRWDVPFLLADETKQAIGDFLLRNDGLIAGIDITGRIPGVTSLTYQFDLLGSEWVEWWSEELWWSGQLEWRNPRNMTFVYGIPHQLYQQLVPRPAEEVEVLQTYGFENTAEFYEDLWWDVWWDVRQSVRAARTVAIWLMVGAAMVIPLSKIKEIDQGFKLIRKVQIEFIMIATFMTWVLIENNLGRVADHITHSSGALSRNMVSHAYFHGLLLIALCLLGYLIHYIKELSVTKGKTLMDDSLVYQLSTKYLAVDLKKDQSLRIFILVFGQALVIAIMVVFVNAMRNPLPTFVFMIGAYLLLVFLYVRYKVAKVKKDYMRLFEITQALAQGNFEVSVGEHLGYFDSLKDELATIQDGFGHAVERALVSERMKGDLITNVSHDLKTPLTSIITYVDLLKATGLSDEKRRQYLETLALKTDRLKTLIEDLFEVSKASSGNLQLDIREVDVVTLMKQTVLGLEDRLNEAGLILREGYPEAVIKMELDGGRMHRVFENLIINIVKYAMPGTRAYIDIIRTDDCVNIILRNISNHEIHLDMNDLSERFIRGEESRTTEGSGLGLAIAKSFVELQGGTFSVAIDGDLFKVMMSFKNQ